MRFTIAHRVVAGSLVALCVAGGFAAAQETEKPVAAADTPDGLRQVWADVLTKAHAGDEDGVRAIIEKMIMTTEDFTAVFGEKGAELAGKYTDKYVKHWPNEAKNIVLKVKERDYDEVDVADTTDPSYAPNDPREEADLKAIRPALKEGTKMYRVKLKKKGEKAGLRYESFFYVNGSWKTGLKVARLFEKSTAAPMAPGK